jgi:hypothetical protein
MQTCRTADGGEEEESKGDPEEAIVEYRKILPALKPPD